MVGNILMKNEAHLCTLIINSLKLQNGWGIKLPVPILRGTPDLLLNIPVIGLRVAEVKWLGDIKRRKFIRKLRVTELQKHILFENEAVTPYSSILLVGMIYNHYTYLIRCKYNESELTEEFKRTHAFTILGDKDKYFDICKLFLTETAYSKIIKTGIIRNPFD